MTQTLRIVKADKGNETVCRVIITVPESIIAFILFRTTAEIVDYANRETLKDATNTWIVSFNKLKMILKNSYLNVIYFFSLILQPTLVQEYGMRKRWSV